MLTVWDEAKRESLWLKHQIEAAAAAVAAAAAKLAAKKAALAAAQAALAAINNGAATAEVIAAAIAAVQEAAAAVTAAVGELATAEATLDLALLTAAALVGFAAGQGFCWIQSRVTGKLKSKKPAPKPVPSHSLRPICDEALRTYLAALGPGASMEELMGRYVTSQPATEAYRCALAGVTLLAHAIQQVEPSVLADDLRALARCRRALAATIGETGAASMSISGPEWIEFAADVRQHGLPKVELTLISSIFDYVEVTCPVDVAASMAAWVNDDPSYAKTGFGTAPTSIGDYLVTSAKWFEARANEIAGSVKLEAPTAAFPIATPSLTIPVELASAAKPAASLLLGATPHAALSASADALTSDQVVAALSVLLRAIAGSLAPSATVETPKLESAVGGIPEPTGNGAYTPGEMSTGIVVETR